MTFFIISYLLISLAYFLYWYGKNRQESIYKISMVLMLPILGYILFFLLWLGRIIRKSNDAPNFMSDISVEKAVNDTAKGFEGERALNLVPMEEALILNDNNIKRRFLLDILKNDVKKNSNLLKKALKNEDTETSHYAATGIIEIKHRLLQSIQECNQKYKENQDEDSLISYAYALKAYQDCALEDEVNEQKNKSIYQNILNELLEFYTQEEDFYIDRINYEIEKGDFDYAAFYCKKFLDAHKQSEKPYLMYLKLFYSSCDKKNFDHTLQALQDFQVSRSSITWDIKNFWMEVRS